MSFKFDKNHKKKLIIKKEELRRSIKENKNDWVLLNYFFFNQNK